MDRVISPEAIIVLTFIKRFLASYTKWWLNWIFGGHFKRFRFILLCVMHPTWSPIIWTWTRFTLCFAKFKSAIFRIIAMRLLQPACSQEMQCIIARDWVTEICWEGTGIPAPILTTRVCKLLIKLKFYMHPQNGRMIIQLLVAITSQKQSQKMAKNLINYCRFLLFDTVNLFSPCCFGRFSLIFSLIAPCKCD